MINKIILIVILLPLAGWSQPTTFTDEEHKFAADFFEKMTKKIPIPSDELYAELDTAMKKVPYHPRFVQALLREKMLVNSNRDFDFGCKYCKKLDNFYLFKFQPILVELCAYAYYMKKNDDELYNRIIPLIEDKNIKGLYLAEYYRINGNEDEFINHAKYSILENYKYESLNYIRDRHLFVYYIMTLNKGNMGLLDSFLKDYEHIIFSSNLNAFFYSSLIQDAIHSSNFVLAKKLIDYVKELDAKKYKKLYPAIAYYHSFKREEELVIAALDKAFEMDKSDFLNSYNSEDRLIFNTYSTSIYKLSDFKTKERMVEKGLGYFEDMNGYKIRFKLYKSMLYAPKDIKAARAILKECEPYLDDINYNDFENIIIIENELGKKKPDYRLIDELLDKQVSWLNLSSLYFQKIMYRYKVNYTTKKTVFTLNEIVEDFDKIFSNPLSQKDEFFYLRTKLLIIGESDKEWFLRELEKLPENLADELIESYNIAENNPEKAAEILSTNQSDLKDINRTVVFINISYLNSIMLKE